MKYLGYDETGALGAVYDLPEWEVEHNPYYRLMRLVPTGEEEVAYPTHYVRDGVVVPRPGLFPTLEKIPGGFLLRGLPVPCVVRVGELVYEVDDGELEWATTVPGVQQVRIEAWPHLGWERPVEVVL